MAGMVAAIGWFSHVTVIYFGFDHILTEKNSQISRFEEENRTLSLRVTSMRDNVSNYAGTLKQSHHNLVGLLSQNDQLRKDVAAMKAQLRTSEAKRAQQIKRYGALNQKLQSIETRLAESQGDGSRLVATLNETRETLKQVEAERNRLDQVRVAAETKIAGLTTRVGRLREEQRDALTRIADKTIYDIRLIEGVIAKTGIKPIKLLKKLDPETYAVGGPFIPALDKAQGFESGPTAIDRHVSHWEALRRVLGNLPLVAPVDHYKLSSGYGPRKDPMNNKLAMHHGIDLAARSRTPVWAPAPGKVVYTGWKGHYGRFIEIDHGLGIRTRYGHLRRIYVRRGQRVDYRKKIGQVGSSGRSTGAHLHYEIIVDGKRVDPKKFLKAGKDVFKG